METDILFSAFCRKFLTFLVVLATARTESLCPNGCTCDPKFSTTTLTVNCQRNAQVSREQLTGQLDSMLSSNLTYGRLRSLTIRNTPLTNVPRSVCQLTTLTELNLDSNQLTRLPDNCLSNLTALTSFSASTNNITELQDGLFDGLSKLQTLGLALNCISSIGLRVFNSSAMLSSLKSVDLYGNKIQTLEPWPLYLGLNGESVQIELRHNSISAFTNMMGWQARCGMEPVSVKVKLNHNHIKHISDFLHGWSINMTTFVCLTPHRLDAKSAVLEFADNPIECDCVDFDMLKVLHQPYMHTTALANTFCYGPVDLAGRKVLAVPLPELVLSLIHI